jgi:hypothetical protein
MVLDLGATAVEPEVPLAAKSVPVQDVALVELRVSVANWPLTIEVGLTESETVGAGEPPAGHQFEPSPVWLVGPAMYWGGLTCAEVRGSTLWRTSGRVSVQELSTARGWPTFTSAAGEKSSRLRPFLRGGQGLRPARPWGGRRRSRLLRRDRLELAGFPVRP